jgi:hypothetical protein
VAATLRFGPASAFDDVTCGGQYVIDDRFSGRGIALRSVPVSSSDEETSYAEPIRRTEVVAGVADHPDVVGPDTEVFHRSFVQDRAGLAALAWGGGRVRAQVEALDVASVLERLVAEGAEPGAEVAFGEDASADASLYGDDGAPGAGSVKERQRVERAGQRTKRCVGRTADGVGEGAVEVQKYAEGHQWTVGHLAGERVDRHGLDPREAAVS